MNKTLLKCASLILAFVLAFGHFTDGRATSQKAALMPDTIVNLAFFYKPPSNSNAATVAGSFNHVILTGGDEAFRDQLLTNGFASTIPQYYRSEGIQDPGSCTANPSNNQIAYKPGDFCDISSNHPDWFLLDTNGNRMRTSPSSSYWRMDPGNAGWRAFFVARLLEINQQKGWQGVFLDNIEASLSEIKRDGVLPAKYQDDASYQAAVKGFIQYLYTNYAQAYDRPLVANIISRSTEAQWFNYTPYLTGAMQERWAVPWSGTAGYLSESKWSSDMALAEKTQAQGRYIILVAQGAKTDTARQNFAFASYLLVSNGKASFRYTDSSIYNEVWLYENYKVQLGSPLGARYQNGTAWRRDFTNGYVVVDPVNGTAKITAGPSATATATRVPPTSTPVVLPTNTVLPTVTQPPATATTSAVFNDTNSGFVYSSGWTQVSDSRAIKGEFMMTAKVGSSVTFPFSGTRFSVIYKTGPVFGRMDVYVDGKLVGTINQNTSTALFKQKWAYGGTLAAGTHTLKLVFASPSGGKVSVDAVSIP